MDNNDHGGNGYSAALATHLAYCYSAAKKPNHYVWFLSNLNHYLIQTPWAGCPNTTFPCMTWEPNSSAGTFSINSAYTNQSPVAVIRSKLDANRARMPATVLSFGPF